MPMKPTAKTRAARAEPFVKFPKWLKSRTDLSMTAKAILIDMLDAQRRHGEVRLSYRTIMKNNGVARTTAIRAVNQLEDAGLILKQTHSAFFRRQSNTYIISDAVPEQRDTGSDPIPDCRLPGSEPKPELVTERYQGLVAKRDGKERSKKKKKEGAPTASEAACGEDEIVQVMQSLDVFQHDIPLQEAVLADYAEWQERALSQGVTLSVCRIIHELRRWRKHVLNRARSGRPVPDRFKSLDRWVENELKDMSKGAADQARDEAENEPPTLPPAVIEQIEGGPEE